MIHYDVKFVDVYNNLPMNLQNVKGTQINLFEWKKKQRLINPTRLKGTRDNCTTTIFSAKKHNL